jgi:hypothetical protein
MDEFAPLTEFLNNCAVKINIPPPVIINTRERLQGRCKHLKSIELNAWITKLDKKTRVIFPQCQTEKSAPVNCHTELDVGSLWKAIKVVNYVDCM